MTERILFEIREPTAGVPPAAARRQAMKFNDPILRHAMPVLSFTDVSPSAKVVGTCFTIIPGLALTARHVVDAWLKNHTATSLEMCPDLPTGGEVLLNIKAVEFGAELASSRTWTIRTLYTSPHTDAALLTLAPDVGGFGPAVSTCMNVLLPQEGDELFAVGWGESETIATANGIKVALSPQFSRGTVVAVHPIQRDSGLYRFPVAQTTLSLSGGMSGGPVLNKAGQLVGLVCGGLDEDVREEEPVGYVSLLWAMLGIQMHVPRKGKPVGEWYRLLDLALEGPLKVFGAEHISLSLTGEMSLTVPALAG